MTRMKGKNKNSKKSKTGTAEPMEVAQYYSIAFSVYGSDDVNAHPRPRASGTFPNRSSDPENHDAGYAYEVNGSFISMSLNKQKNTITGTFRRILEDLLSNTAIEAQQEKRNPGICPLEKKYNRTHIGGRLHGWSSPAGIWMLRMGTKYCKISTSWRRMDLMVSASWVRDRPSAIATDLIRWNMDAQQHDHHQWTKDGQSLGNFHHPGGIFTEHPGSARHTADDYRFLSQAHYRSNPRFLKWKLTGIWKGLKKTEAGIATLRKIPSSELHNTPSSFNIRQLMDNCTKAMMIFNRPVWLQISSKA